MSKISNTYEYKCKWCEGARARVQMEQIGSKDWARAVCVSCNRFLCWLPSPLNIKANDPRATALLAYRVALNNAEKIKPVLLKKISKGAVNRVLPLVFPALRERLPQAGKR
jgi:hypothetical protein